MRSGQAVADVWLCTKLLSEMEALHTEADRCYAMY